MICEKELRHLLGERCHLITTRQHAPGYEIGRIDRSYLAEQIDADRRFYVCGTEEFVDDISEALLDLGAEDDAIVIEE